MNKLAVLFCISFSVLFSIKAETTPERAKEIMGDNFVGVDEVKKSLDITPTETQLKKLAEIPFSEIVLEKYKNTHILVAVFPLSIVHIASIVKGKFFAEGARHFLYEESGVYMGQSWANSDEVKMTHQEGQTLWQLIQKKPRKIIGQKGFVDIEKNEAVPSMRVLVYTIITYYLSTNKSSFGANTLASSLEKPGYINNYNNYYFVSFSPSKGISFGCECSVDRSVLDGVVTAISVIPNN
jgi:hypothetical protein